MKIKIWKPGEKGNHLTGTITLVLSKKETPSWSAGKHETLSRRSLRLNGYGIRSGIKKTRPNLITARANASSDVCRRGEELVTVAEILGHTDIRMTKRYSYAMHERKRQALEKLAATSNLAKCKTAGK